MEQIQDNGDEGNELAPTRPAQEVSARLLHSIPVLVRVQDTNEHSELAANHPTRLAFDRQTPALLRATEQVQGGDI